MYGLCYQYYLIAYRKCIKIIFLSSIKFRQFQSFNKFSILHYFVVVKV